MLALLLTAVAVFALARPSITSWSDPWALQQVQTIFASSAVVFMWMTGIIEPSLMLYHVCALGGFLFFAGVCYKQSIRKYCGFRTVRPHTLRSLRAVFIWLFVASQVGAWMLAGIPLFLESRLNTFSSGGGVGILSRCISFTSFAALFLTVLHIGVSDRKRFGPTDAFVVAFTVLASVANGSKTNIMMTPLLILMSHWIFRRLFSQYEAPTISRKKLTIIALAISLTVLVPLIVEQRNAEIDAVGPLEAVGVRLLLSGDGYMWMYGDDYLSMVQVSSPTALLFADFLGITRLVSWDQLPIHPGLQIFQMLFPNSEAIRGPNLRVDAFGLLYGSIVFGVIFAAAIGVLFGVLRAWLFKARTAIYFLPASYLFFQAPTFFVDPLLGVTALVNTGFAICVTAIAVALVGGDPFCGGLRMRSRYGPQLLSKPAHSNSV